MTKKRINTSKAKEVDPFYSKSNQARLKKSIKELETTGGTIRNIGGKSNIWIVKNRRKCLFFRITKLFYSDGVTTPSGIVKLAFP